MSIRVFKDDYSSDLVHQNTIIFLLSRIKKQIAEISSAQVAISFALIISIIFCQIYIFTFSKMILLLMILIMMY